MTNILNFFLDWKVKLGIALVVICSLFFWHQSIVSKAVYEARYETRLEMQQLYEKRISKLDEASLKAQNELKDTITTQRKEKDARIKSLTAKYNNLLSSLSHRPERTSSESYIPGNPGNAESAGYVDASRLYRNDAAVLVWFATRTEGLKINLQSCYDQYDTVKKKLEDFKNAQEGQ